MQPYLFTLGANSRCPLKPPETDSSWLTLKKMRRFYVFVSLILEQTDTCRYSKGSVKLPSVQGLHLPPAGPANRTSLLILALPDDTCIDLCQFTA